MACNRFLPLLRIWLILSCFSCDDKHILLISRWICRSEETEELLKTGHLFFYLADEDGNALSLSRDAMNIHETSLLASGSRRDIGNWQLHLESRVNS